MRFGLMLFALAFGLTSAASAQEVDGDLAEGEAAEELGDRRFRDTAGYPFGAPASTVRAMQHLAIAMQLRAYCADSNVPDVFVRRQLQRFSELTGREENCRSLLDY